jgi:hypothetical protein
MRSIVISHVDGFVIVIVGRKTTLQLLALFGRNSHSADASAGNAVGVRVTRSATASSVSPDAVSGSA